MIAWDSVHTKILKATEVLESSYGSLWFFFVQLMTLRWPKRECQSLKSLSSFGRTHRADVSRIVVAFMCNWIFLHLVDRAMEGWVVQMRAVPITDEVCAWHACAGKLKIKSISCEKCVDWN